MIDPYIIDILKREEEKERRKRGGRQQIPIHIYPPDFDGYKEDVRKRDETKRGYIEIDIAGDSDDPNTIKM